MSDFDAELDVRQLACPLPILRAKKALQQDRQRTAVVNRAERRIHLPDPSRLTGGHFI
jgi:hypothetical protein